MDYYKDGNKENQVFKVALNCWGANNFGQVGDDTLYGRHIPVIVDYHATAF